MEKTETAGRTAIDQLTDLICMGLDKSFPIVVLVEDDEFRQIANINMPEPKSRHAAALLLQAAADILEAASHEENTKRGEFEVVQAKTRVQAALRALGVALEELVFMGD